MNQNKGIISSFFDANSLWSHPSESPLKAFKNLGENMSQNGSILNITGTCGLIRCWHLHVLNQQSKRQQSSLIPTDYF